MLPKFKDKPYYGYENVWWCCSGAMVMFMTEWCVDLKRWFNQLGEIIRQGELPDGAINVHAHWNAVLPLTKKMFMEILKV